jgi:hypothetical protein
MLNRHHGKSDKKTNELAKKFAEHLPLMEVTSAEIQAHPLKHKCNLEDAIIELEK